MPDISKIKLPSGVVYTLKDTVARSMGGGGIQLKGATTTALTDEDTTNPILIDGESYTAVNQDAVFYGKKEFVFDGTKWHEFGDMSGLGTLAKKDSASGSFTPAGEVSQPEFTGVKFFSSGTFMPRGTVSQPIFTGTRGSVTVSGTPAGTISKGTGTANYTPEGDVSQPITTVELNAESKYVASSATGGGSVTAGTAASATMPVLSTTVFEETLTIGWTDGSFTANKPTEVTLPGFSEQTIATGVKSVSTTKPTFTGTGAELKFTGSTMSSAGDFTPEGSVSQPGFLGTTDNVLVSGTPKGSVSAPTFTGTLGPVTVS